MGVNSAESFTTVHFADLSIERPVVVQDTDEEQASGEEIDQAGAPFAHVESVDAEHAEESEEDPGDGVIDGAGVEAVFGCAFHPGDEEEVDDPADTEEAESEEPDGA